MNARRDELELARAVERERDRVAQFDKTDFRPLRSSLADRCLENDRRRERDHNREARRK